MNKKINLPDDFSEIHLIPYMHTDYSWTNSRPWHIRRYTCGLGRALEIMRTDPDFTYVIDNVHHSFSVFEKYCPELMPEFEERVKEGRLVIANGGYSLARPDYCGEEAYVRNIVGGQRYFRSRFDIPDGESHFFFNADTGIGHSQLPQILRLTGNRYYRSNRPSETMNRKGIPRQFVWQGLDGSRIIVARGDYGGLFVTDWLDRNPDIDKGWQEILDGYWGAEQNNACNSASDKLMLFFGCDDVIPGCNLIDRPVPYREFIAGWNRKQRGKMMLSTPGRYFGRLESEKDTLPVVDGVLDNCELSYNIPYKGQNSMWYRRRVLERLILRLEYMRSMLNGLGYQCGYDDVGELWVDMMSINYLEFNMPWWDDNATESLTIDGFLPTGVSDLTLLDKSATYVVFYNLSLGKELSISEDMYKTVDSGDWTQEKLRTLGLIASKDMDGDGSIDRIGTDRYGILGNDSAVTALFGGTGGRYVSLDGEGQPYISFNTEKNIGAMQDFLEKILFDESLFCNTSWVDGFTEVDSLANLFMSDLGLFYIRALDEGEKLRNMRSEYAILPVPKSDAAQKEYYCPVSVYSNNLISVPYHAEDTDRTGVIIEALSAESYYSVNPEFYDKVLDNKIARDEETKKMLDIIFDSRLYDLGEFYGLAYFSDKIRGVTGHSYELTGIAKTSDIASFYETYRPLLEAALKDLIRVVDDWNSNAGK